MSRQSLTLSLLLIAGMACNPATPKTSRPTADTGPNLSRFASCDDMRAYMADAWTESLVSAMYGGGYGVDVAVAEDGASTSASGGDDGGADGPTEWSETNTQEADVDEADMVKTDGEYIYVVQRGTFTVVDAWPAEESAVVGTLDIPGEPYSMFVAGDRALVYSYDYGYRGFEGGYGYADTTLMLVLDISDRAHPEITREIRLEGWMTSARMVDNDVYTVVNAWTSMPDVLWSLAWNNRLGLPQMDYRWTEAQVALARNRARNTLRPLVEEVLAGIPTDELLPAYTDGAPDSMPDAQPLLACTDIYRPNAVSNPNTLSVVHVNLGNDDSAVSATGLMADGWTVYGSKDHLVVAQSSSSWWWGYDDPEVVTHLHQFVLEGENTVYEMSGVIPGWLLNQFSMSEFEGSLRVATTDFGWWGTAESEGPPANNVFVLQASEDQLSIVGAVRGIAPGETIQSARFLGKKGYVVTYEQTDPLFTLDLSDPTTPTLVGELVMPGFSTYLHPLGDDHLVGVGFAGTMDGAITGLAVSLFDVSNFAAPALADQFTMESDDWSYSEALYDHHAFTLFNGVLSMPAYTWDWDAATGDYTGFSGMLVLQVDTSEGLSELGRIDHSTLVERSTCIYDSSRSGPCSSDWWYASMRRSVVVDDNLYSISDYGVVVTPVSSPAEPVAEVLFYPL